MYQPKVVFKDVMRIKISSAKMLKKIKEEKQKEWRAPPGFEPGTSRTLSENHTPRPKSQLKESGGVQLFVPGEKLVCTGLGVA